MCLYKNLGNAANRKVIMIAYCDILRWWIKLIEIVYSEEMLQIKKKLIQNSTSHGL